MRRIPEVLVSFIVPFFHTKQKRVRNTLLIPVMILLMLGPFLTSCQKEVNGDFDSGVNPSVQQKPRVGTTWTYRYYIYHVNGGIFRQFVFKYRATEEQTINGEKFLVVKEVDRDSLIGLFGERAGGLNYYANNTSYLLFKDTAGMLLNSSYPTFFEGRVLNPMTIKGIGDTTQSFIGDVPANYYEGYSLTTLFERIWYSKYYWIIRQIKYIFFFTTYYKYSSLELMSIVY
jgi:hypothetical protein